MQVVNDVKHPACPRVVLVGSGVPARRWISVPSALPIFKRNSQMKIHSLAPAAVANQICFLRKQVATTAILLRAHRLLNPSNKFLQTRLQPHLIWKNVDRAQLQLASPCPYPPKGHVIQILWQKVTVLLKKGHEYRTAVIRVKTQGDQNRKTDDVVSYAKQNWN